ncbi:MAG: tetratricopeptide repeat protein [Nitrosopumilus sp.]|nr:tetratricopeptide repeat protein [Nitrosopumilus sp.]MDA7957647.1 tetratricopeptide repeat protein [Nitrosopumilus sp.]MDA7960271.1 tetratricopeptide repeat protein [Nitrosopumilus sp.]
MALDLDDGRDGPGHRKLQEADVYNEEAERLIRGGEYVAARRRLELASGTAPGDVRTVYNMAVLDDATGRYYEAADHLDWLLEARRSSGDAHGAPSLDGILVLRGLVHAHEGDHEAAIECYDKLSCAGVRTDAAYYRADSLYRLGRYDEAAAWYEKAGRFRDAAKRQGEIHGMRKDMHDRVWIPLIAADTPAGIPSMPHIQYVVYLAQTEKTRKYRFDSSAPGPYSEDLALDIARNTELFKVDRGDRYSFSQRRTYTLTSKGRDVLGHAKLDGDIIAGIKKYRDMDVVDLARLAHARFSEHFDAVYLGQMIRKIIEDADGDDKISGYQHGSVGMEAHHAKHVLSEIAGNTGSVDKKAIYGMVGIIVNRCERIRLLSGSPVDHYEIQRIIEDLDEYGGLLLKYAKTNKIVTYPAILNPVKKTAG